MLKQQVVGFGHYLVAITVIDRHWSKLYQEQRGNTKLN